MERIIFCVHENVDVKIYNDLMPLYFPVVEKDISGKSGEEAKSQTEGKAGDKGHCQKSQNKGSY